MIRSSKIDDLELYTKYWPWPTTVHHDKQNSGQNALWLIRRHSIHTFPPKKHWKSLRWLGHVARHYAMCAQGATLPLPPLVPDCMATHGIPLWNQTLDDLISRNIACRDKQRVKNQEKHLWEIIRWCSMSQYKLVEVLTFDTATQSACNLHFPVGFGAPLLPSRSAKILGVPGFPGWVSNRSKLGVYDTLNQHLCLSCLERLANMKIMNYEDSFDESLIYVWYLRESCKKRNKSSRNALAV